MEFIPLVKRCEEITRHETRDVELGAQNKWGIYPGHYAFLESFCSDDTCDCRKVMIAVCQIEPQDIVATIGYGWESAAYYTKWMCGDEKMGKMLAGSYLEPGAQQSPMAYQWLKIWDDLIITDDKYRERISRHYRLFKNQEVLTSQAK